MFSGREEPFYSRREACFAGAAALSTFCFSGCKQPLTSQSNDPSRVPRVQSDELDPHTRGVKLGSNLRPQIHDATTWYHSLFDVNKFPTSKAILEYQSAIKELLPHLYQELQGMAVGAEISIGELVMLNARSELLQSMWSEKVAHPSECSAAWVPQLRCLTQTWDWATESILWCSVNSITVAPDLHATIFTEAGMLGKIGVNSKGVGVLLTFVDGPVEHRGIPIHLLSRVALECSSVEEVINRLCQIPTGSTGALLVADKNGTSAILEFFGGELSIAKGHEVPMTHTNHLLLSHAKEAIAYAHPADYEYSVKRQRDLLGLQLNSVKGGANDVGSAVRSSNVCVSAHQDPFIGNYGTCAVVTINLAEGSLLLS